MPRADAFLPRQVGYSKVFPTIRKHLCPLKDAFYGILRSADILQRIRASPAEFLAKILHIYCWARSVRDLWRIIMILKQSGYQ